MYAEELTGRRERIGAASELRELNRMVETLMQGNRDVRAVASGMLAVLQRVNAAGAELIEHLDASDPDERTRKLADNLRRALEAE